MNTLSFNQFSAAVALAKDTFKTLRFRHPTLNAYLVLALAVGQAGIDESPEQLLVGFPEMIVDDEIKAEALRILKTLKKAESDAERALLKELLKKTCEGLHVVAECQVELRFNDLNYGLIEQLKQDDLVDQTLTPRNQASIRIVLGTLERFALQS